MFEAKKKEDVSRWEKLTSTQKFKFDKLNHKKIRQLVRKIIIEDRMELPKEEIQRWNKTASLKTGNSREKTLAAYDKLISGMVDFGVKSILVRDVAKAIVQLYSIGAGFDVRDDIWVFAAIQDWIQRNINYILDAGQQKEIFQTPQRQLIDWARGTTGSDCDDMAILYVALLRTIGKDAVVVLIDGHASGQYNHAMAFARSKTHDSIFKGQWIPVELTLPKPLGWIVNHTKTYKVR